VHDTPPSIFRPAAVRRYGASCAEPAPPPFVSPRTFLVLWALLALLLLATAFAWFERVPIYTSAPAVAVRATGGAQSKVVLVAFVPPQDASHVRAGTSLFLASGPQGKRAERQVTGVDRTVQSPDALRRRLGLQGSAALLVRQPSALAFAQFGPLPAGVSASTYLGSVWSVDLPIGSLRVLSLVPLVGQMVGG
jgi:hypothetical protein